MNTMSLKALGSVVDGDLDVRIYGSSLASCDVVKVGMTHSRDTFGGARPT